MRTSHSGNHTVTAYQPKPAHQEVESSASIHGVEAFQSQMNRVSITGVEAKLRGQNKTKSHLSSKLRQSQHHSDFAHVDLALVQRFHCCLKDALMLYQLVGFRDDADRNGSTSTAIQLNDFVK
jgi:hypothetical protein